MEPSKYSFAWPDKRGPFTVVLHLCAVKGRMECVGFEILSYAPDALRETSGAMPVLRDIRNGVDDMDHAVPLTATDLREVPLGKLVADRLSKIIKEGLDATWDRPFVRDYRIEVLDAAQASRAGRGGRKGHGPEHYENVAAVYAEAWENGLYPTQAVAEHWTVAKTTAAKWVARAREFGFLERTSRGRAGGAPTRSTEEGDTK